jgi:signal transduction histidine kinase
MSKKHSPLKDIGDGEIGHNEIEHHSGYSSSAGSVKESGYSDDRDDSLKREFGDPELATDKQQEIFLRGIAHDVNNNLMAIVTGCDQLEYRSATVDPKDVSQSIRTHVKAVSSLMRDLLSNQNMDAPMVMYQDELKSLLKGILPSLSLVAGQNTQIELGDFNVPPVNVHPLLLHRVLLQLIRNVSELNIEKPLAFIAARRHGDWCEISVSDNGPGIPDIQPEEIFEPGFTTKGQQGTRGHGLAAVVWAVKTWGGEYGVDHIAGDTGCRFWVRLPLKEPAS